MIGAEMFPAVFPWDTKQDAKIRTANFVDHGRFGNSARENIAELLWLNQHTGHEASDYQNPYAFATLGVLDYPSPFGTELMPTYGVGDSGQAEQDVLINIRATQNAIIRG